MKCYECKTNVAKADAIHEGGHYFHNGCFVVYTNRQAFAAYVCQLYGLKAPGPVIYSQRKNFIEKYGYTDDGMIKALRYAYEVKHIKITKAESRIGIIPSVYEDAQKFFEAQERKQNKIVKEFAKLTDRTRTVIVNLPKERSVELNDMDALSALEEEE